MFLPRESGKASVIARWIGAFVLALGVFLPIAKAGITGRPAAEVSQKAYELVQFRRCEDFTREEVLTLPGCESARAITAGNLNDYAEDLFFAGGAEYQKQWSSCRMQKSALYERELARDGALKKAFLNDFVDRLERLHRLYEKTDERLQKLCRDRGHYMLKVTREGQHIYEGCGKFAELNAGNSSSQFTDPELIEYARQAEQLLAGIPESQSSPMQKLITEYAFSRKAKNPRVFLDEASAQGKLREVFRQTKNDAHADFSAFSLKPGDRLPESVRSRLARNTDFMNFYLNELRDKRGTENANDPTLDKLWCRMQGRYVKGPEYIANSLNAATWLFWGGSALRLGVVAWTGRGLLAVRSGGLLSRTGAMFTRAAAWAGGGAAATRALMDYERVCQDPDLTVDAKVKGTNAKPTAGPDAVMDRLRQCGDVETELKEIERGSCYDVIAEHGLETAGVTFALAYKGAKNAKGALTAPNGSALREAGEKGDAVVKRVMASPTSPESLDFLPAAQRTVALRHYKHVENLTSELRNQLNVMNKSLKEGEPLKTALDLDPRKLEELKEATLKYMRWIGLSVEKDPSNASLVVLKSLPSYHPDAKVFAEATDKLEARFTYNVWHRVEGDVAGYQRGGEISSRDVIQGGLRSKNSLHEIGHRSSERRGMERPLELYNTDMMVDDGYLHLIPKELGPVPAAYKEYLNYDELKQYSKDLWRSEGRGAKALGTTQLDKTHNREMAGKLAESVASQSDYVLSHLKKGGAAVWDGSSDHVYVPIRDTRGRHIGQIHFNLRGFRKPQDSDLRLATEVMDAQGKTKYVENVYGDNGLKQVEISYDTYEAIMASWDRRLLEREDWVRERVKEMAESNKAEAKYVLRRLYKQPLPKYDSGYPQGPYRPYNHGP